MINKIKIFFYTKKLKLFYKKHPELYIYGTGVYGEIVGGYLFAEGITYAGYVVSTMKDKKILLGHSVSEFDESLLDNPYVGFVLAMNKKNSTEVMETHFKNKKEKVFTAYSKLKY